METVDSSGFIDNLSDTIIVAGDNALMGATADRQRQDATSVTVDGNDMALVDEQRMKRESHGL